MINIQKWFSDNFNKSKDFRLNYNSLLEGSYLTQRNLDDFNHPKYKNYISKLDIFKYNTVLDYLIKNNEYCLAYNLNPYLLDNNSKNINTLYPYNDRLEVNMYKNILIDLYFLDIPRALYDNEITLDILLGLTKDNTGDLKDLYKMGYGFDYFGKKSMTLFFMLYFKAYYKNITLYEYNDRYFNLGQVLTEYSVDKLQELKENNSVLNQEKLYNYLTFLDSAKEGFIKDQLEIKIFNDILSDSSLVKPLHYECTSFVSPLDYQELNNSHFSEYCLLYHFDKFFSMEDMIDFHQLIN